VGVGSTLANKAFLGVANNKVSQEQVVIRLSDFYNPTGVGTYPKGSPFPEGQPKPKILLLDVSSVWCGPCNNFSANIAPVQHKKYAPQGVEFMLTLVDGPTEGQPATFSQLHSWDKKYAVDFPSALDPTASTIALWPASAFPSLLLIDTRTMKLVTSVSGGLPVDDPFWTGLEAALAKDTSTGAGGAGGSGGAGSGGAGQGGAPADDPSCSGGVIVNGVCEGRCSPDKCLAGNTCVGNRCVLVCASQADCAPDGTQNCAPAVEDSTGAAIQTCQPNGKVAGIGTPCPNGTECAGFQACPDGSPCASGGCAPELCKPLTCTNSVKNNLGQYCTLADCKADTDCPGGYACEDQRDPHALCGSNPPKGNNAYCGTTQDACVAAADFAKDGATYSEGELCLQRKYCKKRDYCWPCANDLDCGNLPGGRCVDVGGSNRCVAACAASSDCPANASCVAGTCQPSSGACEGQGKLCDVCQTDSDCPGGYCYSTGRERACVPLNKGTPCTNDASCPTVQSGKQGTCLNDFQGVSPDSPLFGTCSLPQNKDTLFSGCW
jgi:hypothetical protein